MIAAGLLTLFLGLCPVALVAGEHKALRDTLDT